MRTYSELTELGRLPRLRFAAIARLSESLVLPACAAQAAAGGPAEALRRLRGASRGAQRVARARQRAMYLSHVAGGLSLAAVSIIFGRDRTTVRHACALCEDARDEPGLDHAFARQEAALAAMALALGLSRPAATLKTGVGR